MVSCSKKVKEPDWLVKQGSWDKPGGVVQFPPPALPIVHRKLNYYCLPEDETG